MDGDYRGIKYQDIIDVYKKCGSVWKTGEYFSIAGQQIHKILSDLGEVSRMNYWTEKDNEVLKKSYLEYRNNADLKTLAYQLNRTVPFIARKAKILGLTDRNNRVSMKRFAKQVGERTKKYIEENGHPKGMKGKFHSQEFKEAASKRTTERWKDPNSSFNSSENRQRLSDNMSKNQALGNLANQYSRAKQGTVIIGGKTNFFRSEWEVNVCAYFEFLKTKGEIKDWEYEPDVFWFHEIKRGVRSYKPDFRITLKNGDSYYEEVKGWMDTKSITKLKRMRIYYPDIEVRVLDQARYKEISKMKSIIPHWGDLTNGNAIEKEKCKLDICQNNSFKENLCRKHYKKVYGTGKKPK